MQYTVPLHTFYGVLCRVCSPHHLSTWLTRSSLLFEHCVAFTHQVWLPRKKVVDLTGVATQILLGFFPVYGVIHFGTAGNAYSGLHIGDVTIPRQWAHTGLWSWQKHGEGENDELPLEKNGDYTRDIGYLNFANYSTPLGKDIDNQLNNVWFQADEIFPVNGTPEVREQVFWIPVSQSYYELAQKIENVKLDSCVNSTCLSHEPRIVRVQRGCSANVFVANAAYKSFLGDKFNVTTFDMESAGVAMICLSEGKPFIAMRALVSDPSAEGSHEENKSGIFIEVATKNTVTAITQFINLLPSPRAIISDPEPSILGFQATNARDQFDGRSRAYGNLRSKEE